MLLLAPGREHGGGDAVRPYTPISSSEMAGKFQLMIKRYREWGDPRWPHSYCPPGAVSNYLFELKPGAMVKFKHTKFNVKLPYVVDGKDTTPVCLMPYPRYPSHRIVSHRMSMFLA